MNWKRTFTEAATLAVLAALCALVANALASRERRLALVGSYPDATRLPARATPAPLPDAAPAVEAAAAPVPAASAVSTVSAAAPTAVAAPRATSAPASPAQKAPAPGKAIAGAPKSAATPAAPAAAPAPLTDRFPPHPDRPFAEISGADATFLHGRGALVLDARRTSVYEEGHIAGARSFPVWESDVDRRVEALVGEARDPKQPIVLYCAGGDCEDSHMLAQKLFGAGFENLLVYRDGYPDWVKRGGATKAGPQP